MIGGWNPWFFEELARRLAELRTEHAAALVAGSAQDYPQYRQVVGMAAGLETALQIAEEIRKECERA